MRRIRLLAFAAVLAAFAFGSTAVAKPPDVNSSKLREAVTVDGIVDHQRALQAFHEARGPRRFGKRVEQLQRLLGVLRRSADPVGRATPGSAERV